MIEINSKFDCCGCGACCQICPRQCIIMSDDEEGFLYPIIEKNRCIDCGLCGTVCPTINSNEERTPISTFAATCIDEEIRQNSSSGGVFTLLSTEFLKENGAIFGARFEQDWIVVHSCVETQFGLSKLRGSKYLQSRIGDTFIQAKKMLEDGRQVLYSGTPCQIAGLRNFLRKDYENLLTVDFVCHGVPSPKVWLNYLENTISYYRNKYKGKNINVDSISFRDKHLGWKNFSFVLAFSIMDVNGLKKSCVHSEPFMENIFMKGFLANLYLRPSCYCCPVKKMKSGSDITIGDFWGVEKVMPDFYNDKGVSLVLINTNKGYNVFKTLNIQKRESCYSDALKGNTSIVKSVHLTIKRDFFFKEFLKGRNLEVLINKLAYTPFLIRIGRKVTQKIKNYIIR